MIVSKRLRIVQIKYNVSISILKIVSTRVLLLHELLQLDELMCFVAYLFVFFKSVRCFCVLYSFKVFLTREFG